jgi:hypothetical protein
MASMIRTFVWGFVVAVVVDALLHPSTAMVPQPRQAGCDPTCACQCHQTGCGCHEPIRTPNKTGVKPA